MLFFEIVKNFSWCQTEDAAQCGQFLAQMSHFCGWSRYVVPASRRACSRAMVEPAALMPQCTCARGAIKLPVRRIDTGVEAVRAYCTAFSAIPDFAFLPPQKKQALTGQQKNNVILPEIFDKNIE